MAGVSADTSLSPLYSTPPPLHPKLYSTLPYPSRCAREWQDLDASGAGTKSVYSSSSLSLRHRFRKVTSTINLHKNRRVQGVRPGPPFRSICTQHLLLTLRDVKHRYATAYIPWVSHSLRSCFTPALTTTKLASPVCNLTHNTPPRIDLDSTTTRVEMSTTLDYITRPSRDSKRASPGYNSEDKTPDTGSGTNSLGGPDIGVQEQTLEAKVGLYEKYHLKHVVRGFILLLFTV